MNRELEEYRKERDAIIEEIGEFDEEDFVKSGISLEEYTSPNEDVIQRLVEYVSTEYNQTSVYTDSDDEQRFGRLLLVFFSFCLQINLNLLYLFQEMIEEYEYC